MHTAALLTIARRQKQPKYPSKDEWIDKLWSISTTKYYSAIKRNDALTPATAWMNLENITLRGSSQAQKVPFI